MAVFSRTPFFLLVFLEMLLAATLFPISVGAVEMFSANQNDLSIYSSPKHPKPNESVEIFIESYTTNLDQATMTWSINGKTERRGAGIKSVVVPAGPIGIKKSITVLVATKEGRVFEQSISINPSEVEILWESDTYTPPFYKGKALYSSDADLSLLAVPISKGTNPANLVYTWKKDGTLLPNLSGFGKQFITIKTQFQIDPVKMEVEVSSGDGSYSARGEIVIPPTQPKVLVYENRPLSGFRFDKAVGSQQGLIENEVSFVGIPYFFSAAKRNVENLFFSWTMNGASVVPSEKDKATLILRHESGVTGSSQIGLSVENRNGSLQRSTKEFSVIYGN